jgi:HEAT repeat protein
MKTTPLRLVLIVFLFILLGTRAPQAHADAPPADSPMIAGKPLNYWIDQLKADNALDREESLEVLAQAGPTAKAALPAVRELLKDQPLTVRFRAALVMWKVGGEAAQAVPVMADMLSEPNRGLRLRAAQTLVQFGPAAEPAAPALVQRLTDKDDGVRFQVGMALEQLGNAAIPALTKGAEAGSPVRRESIDVLGRLGPRAADAVPAMTAALKDDDPKTRTAAAAALWRVDRTNAAAVPILIEGFKSNDPVARAQASNILFSIKPRPKEAADVFAEALKGNDIVTRVKAADAVWDLNCKPDEVLPTLIEAVKSNSINVRNPALDTLRRMGPKAKPALPALVELLGTTGIATAQFNETFLALGPDAIGELTKAMEEKPVAIKQVASQMLGIAGPDAVEPLRKLTTHNDQTVRLYAVFTLGHIGPSAPDKVLPILAETLKDKDRNVRLQTLLAYREVGPEAGDAPAAVVELLKDRDSVIRTNAVSAVERLRVDPQIALPLLEEIAAKDDSVFNRVRALELCWKLDPKKHPAKEVVKQEISLNQHARVPPFVTRAGADGRDAILLMVEALETHQGPIRQQFLDTLAGFGADAKAARPILVEQLKDPQAANRVLAALNLIQTGDTESALPILIAALKDNTVSVIYHERVHAALRKLGPDAKAAVPALRQIVGETDISIFRIHCAATLAKLDPEHKEAAVAALTEIMGRTNSYLQLEAAAALLELDKNNRRALTTMEQGLVDVNAYNRQVAARKLGQLGADAKAALPALRRATEDDTATVRFAAAVAWWKIDGKNAKALAAITDTIKDSTASFDMRMQAVNALGELGEDVKKEAVPVLLEALRDRHASVRVVAETALKKVDPEAARKAGY